MGDIEKATKPVLLQLMHGNPYALDHEQQRSLATWIAIKAMVWDYVQTKRAIPKAEREYVYANKIPPPDWRVWVGRTDAEFGYSGAFAVVRLFVFENADGSIWPEPTEDTIANTQCFLIYSGAFVGVALRFPFANSVALEPGETLHPIWPISAVVSWPPSFVIPVDEAIDVPDFILDALRKGLG